MKDLVSVIIPVYNKAVFLSEAIESVINQTYKNLEIIVINDGSTDGSADIVKKYQNKYPTLFKVIHQNRSGASHARNVGIGCASGKFIQFLDGDDVLDRNKIHSQMSQIDHSCSETLFFGKWAYFNEEVGDTIPEDFPFYRNYQESTQLLLDLWIKQQMIALFSWLIPLSLIKRAGPWNENLSLNDDGEFMARVIRCSRKVVFCKDSLGYYRKPSSDNLSTGRTLKSAKSMFQVFSNYEQLTEDLSNNCLRNRGLIKNYEHFIYRMNAVDLELTEQAWQKIKKISGKTFPYSLKESKLLFLSQFLGIRFPLLLKRKFKLF